MKRRRIITVVYVVLLLCMVLAGFYLWHWNKAMNRINNYQPMRIMVDGIMYSHGGGIKEERPEGPPDGTITEITDAPHIYPQKDGQANFGPVGTPYWHYGNKIVVECDKYCIFD